jgi:transcriptional regulator with XRE-family HTH domain
VEGSEALREALKVYVAKVRGEMSQERFAAALGVSQATVSNLLSGTGNVTMRHVAQFARLQGKTVGAVLLEVAALVVTLEAQPPAAPLLPGQPIAPLK